MVEAKARRKKELWKAPSDNIPVPSPVSHDGQWLI